MQRAPHTLPQRRLDIALFVLAVLTAAAVVVTLVYDSRPAQSAAEPRYTPPVVENIRANTKTALFIGDSYTAGVGVTSENRRWTRIASNKLGWVENNIGFGGTGYVTSIASKRSQSACRADYCPSYTEALETYEGPTPDVVVVAGGRNDVVKAVEEYQPAVASTLSAIEERFPDARLYVVSPVWDEGLPPMNLSNLSGIVRDATTEAEATFVDVGQPLEEGGDLLAEDGVHPSTLGHAALADAFVDAVK